MYPVGFSSGIGLVLFQPISKLGGSGFTSPLLDFRSRIISDFLRLSIGKLSGSSEYRGGIGKSSGAEFSEFVHLVLRFDL